LIPFEIFAFEVCQQTATLADHPEQALPGVMVFLVDPEVFGEVLDGPREKRDLNLGRSRIRIVGPEAGDGLGLFFRAQGHCDSSTDTADYRVRGRKKAIQTDVSAQHTIGA